MKPICEKRIIALCLMAVLLSSCLSYASDGDYTPPQDSYTEADEFVPVEKALAMSPKAFFDAANALMSANPPAAADAELLEKRECIIQNTLPLFGYSKRPFAIRLADSA